MIYVAYAISADIIQSTSIVGDSKNKEMYQQ